ncbi:hypothetical protein CCR75_004830 [Bremia lactucae]|uniref:FYVE-type domain-containing protein n=1 Tax=Bremia lactucae TaxID=4779 RepID=A0A976FHI2_BRELC|nr:hypothetical protein CCR75_004830 [Bremia lactucae]
MEVYPPTFQERRLSPFSILSTATKRSSDRRLGVAVMSHRFPIQEVVFPPLRLSESNKDKFMNTASMKLAMALRDYDKHQAWQASRPPNLRYQLHPSSWKTVKTCEQLTVYRKAVTDATAGSSRTLGSRRRARSRTLDAMTLAANRSVTSISSAPTDSVTECSWSEIPTQSSGALSRSDRTMPTLLQVGTIEGTLNDVMYSSVSFDALGTIVTSSYTSEEVVDAEALYELQGPTPEDPFRYCGLKWVVKCTSSSVKAFTWPRDLVFLVATGIITRQGGKRVGYHLMHSVDLGKDYGPLDGKRIVRGRISSCYFYRETSSKTVDVYMKTNFEPNGSMHESVALLSAATSLTQCVKFAQCAQNKKLSWLLAHPKTDEVKAGSARSSTQRKKKRHDCAVCTRSISAFARCFVCRLCNGRVCSSCSLKKKLSFPGQRYKTIEPRSINFCTHCLTHARNMDAQEIAEQEVKERQQMNRQRIQAENRSDEGQNDCSSQIPRYRHNLVIGRIGDGEHLETGKEVPTVPTVRRHNQKPCVTHDLEVKPVSSYPSNDSVESLNQVLLPLDSEPWKTYARTRSNSKKTMLKAIEEISRNKISGSNAVAETSRRPDLPKLDDSLPEAVVQYAWGAVVPSPTNEEALNLESSPFSSLSTQSPTDVWPSAEGDKTSLRTPPLLQPTSIPRIHAGASTQEVMAQFAELCNAAESVFQVAKKHTNAHLDPTELHARHQTTRFDMSAVD